MFRRKWDAPKRWLLAWAPLAISLHDILPVNRLPGDPIRIVYQSLGDYTTRSGICHLEDGHCIKLISLIG